MTNVRWSGSKYMQATGGTRLVLGLELPSTQDQLELDIRQGLDEISEIPVVTIVYYVNNDNF